jgi:hypothetical protein
MRETSVKDVFGILMKLKSLAALLSDVREKYQNERV